MIKDGIDKPSNGVNQINVICVHVSIEVTGMKYSLYWVLQSQEITTMLHPVGEIWIGNRGRLMKPFLVCGNIYRNRTNFFKQEIEGNLIWNSQAIKTASHETGSGV